MGLIIIIHRHFVSERPALLSNLINFVSIEILKVDVPITIVGGESMLVTFTGVGYDQRIMGDTMMFADRNSSSIPDRQLIQVPEQVTSLRAHL